MFNRTLNRPMFRRGGKAGGGIMTGVQRQGYDGTDDKQLVEDNDPMKDIGKKVTDRVNIIESLTPKYPYKGSDFFMGLGANILAAPGGQPIFQTIGTAAKEPLNLLMKQNIAEYGNKRDTVMQVFKQLSDEDKDALINRAEQMVAAGRFKTVQEALQVLVPTYRKDQSPEETEREDLLRKEKLQTTQIEDLAKIYEIGRTDAVVLNDFMNDLSEGKYKGVYHDPEQYYIEDSDVGRGTDETEKRLVIRDYDPEKSDYKEGRVYIDFLTKKAFVKQGQFLIPYEDYISETISTD
jgi:hypothetical protein